jgi:hypothetical protein
MVRKILCALLASVIVISTVQLNPAYSQSKYKAKGQIDPAQVRSVVNYLGVGERVKIKLDQGTELNGNVQKIESDRVTLVDAKTGETRVVAFAQIREVQKKKFPAWGKVLIVTGSVIGILLALMYAQCGSGGCH